MYTYQSFEPRVNFFRDNKFIRDFKSLSLSSQYVSNNLNIKIHNSYNVRNTSVPTSDPNCSVSMTTNGESSLSRDNIADEMKSLL